MMKRMKKATNQKASYLFFIFCSIVPILERDIRGMKYIGAIMFLILLIYISLDVIMLVQEAILCRNFEELYESIKTAEKERHKSYFIINSEQRESNIKKWNDLLQKDSNQLIKTAEQTLRRGNLTKRQETKIREMVKETRKILTTE